MTRALRLLPASLAAAAAILAAAPVAGGAAHVAAGLVRIVRIHYVAHDGKRRGADIVLPRWYGPAHDPQLPLVISPHGRGSTAAANAALWGELPALGDFAVVNPEGQGRRLPGDSWGDPGEIRDLARMPALLERALPWLRIDRRRIYAVGDSMGGQEALLLAARDPRLLAGAVAFDAPANLALRYHALSRLSRRAQQALVYEVGGTPTSDPRAYALRSPLHWARALAFSHVPLELWWSRRDGLIRAPGMQSEKLFQRILALNPRAPVVEYVGAWQHGREMRDRLPRALRRLGLLRARAAGRGGHTWGRTVMVRPPEYVRRPAGR